MKTLAYYPAMLLLVLGLVALAACSDDDHVVAGSQTVIGSGVMAQEDRPVGNFTRINLVGVGHVHFDQGPLSPVQVECEDNLMQRLVTEVQAGTLVIRTRSGFNLQPTMRLDYHVTAPALDSISLSGAGEIDITGLTVPQLSVLGSGVGEIDVLNLDAQSLDVVASGVLGIGIAGQVVDQTVLVSGLGDYNARDLASTNAAVTISGLGDATVRVSTDLTATITSSGSVFYIGNPAVHSTITGSGRVEQIP